MYLQHLLFHCIILLYTYTCTYAHATRIQPGSTQIHGRVCWGPLPLVTLTNRISDLHSATKKPAHTHMHTYILAHRTHVSLSLLTCCQPPHNPASQPNPGLFDPVQVSGPVRSHAETVRVYTSVQHTLVSLSFRGCAPSWGMFVYI